MQTLFYNYAVQSPCILPILQTTCDTYCDCILLILLYCRLYTADCILQTGPILQDCILRLYTAGLYTDYTAECLQITAKLSMHVGGFV